MLKHAAEARCSSCFETKLLNDFPPDKRLPNGRGCRCRDCCRAANKAWYEAGGWRRQSDRREIDRGKLLRYYAKKRAVSKGLAYDLDEHKQELERRVMGGLCELSGKPFDFAASQGFYSPSIDRIKPDIGYLYSNIRVIAFGLNVAINQWGEDVLLDALAAIQEKRDALT